MSDDLATWLLLQLSIDDERFRVGHAADAEWRCLDVESKRRVIDEIVPKLDHMDDMIEGEWGGGGPGAHEESDLLLRLLALPYAGREGYCAEWRV